MEFRRQLVVGHSALLLVTLITAAVAAIALRISSARLESVSRDLVADMFAIQRLQLRAEQVVATSRGYLLTGEARSLPSTARRTAPISSRRAPRSPCSRRPRCRSRSPSRSP
jgi:uncharacterized protein (DUF3084 family)